jgi:hypothetical protein
MGNSFLIASFMVARPKQPSCQPVPPRAASRGAHECAHVRAIRARGAHIRAIGLVIALAGCGSASPPAPAAATDADTTPLDAARDASGSPDVPADLTAAAADVGAQPADAPVPPPDPSILAKAGGNTGGLRLAGGFLYWSEDGTRIVRMPVMGGSQTTIASATPKAPQGIRTYAIDSDHVYWIEPGNLGRDVLFSAPVAGGNSAMLAQITSSYALAADSGFVYYTAQQAIWRLPGAGGTPAVVVSGVDTITPLIADGGYVYFVWPKDSFFQDLHRAPVAGSTSPADAGGDPGMKVSSNSRGSTLVPAPRSDGGNFYWAIYDLVFKWPVAGGAQELIGQVSDPLVPAGSSVQALYPSKGIVYWISGGFLDDAYLWKLTPGGNPREQLAVGRAISSLAADDTYVYFTDGQSIRRVAR